jgi:Protein of unknown function (DUF2971)
MGDPWESGSFGIDPMGSRTVTAIWDAVVPVSKEQRDQVRILSLTRDRPSGAADSAGYQAARGFARPRMWETYGDRHQGVCFVFETESLVKSFDSLGLTNAFSGNVNYEPPSVDLFQSLLFDVVGIHDLAILSERIAVKLINDREMLLFRKHPDWSGEDEFRLLHFPFPSIGSDPRLVPFESSIKGIVVGERATARSVSRCWAIAKNLGLRDSFGKLRWKNGIPDMVPFVETAKGSVRRASKEELESPGLSGGDEWTLR